MLISNVGSNLEFVARQSSTSRMRDSSSSWNHEMCEWERMAQTKWTCLVMGMEPPLLSALQHSTMSRSKGMVKVTPMLPAKKTTLSNWRRGLIVPYGPSRATRRVESESTVVFHFSAWLRMALVAPDSARMRNSIFLSEGREEMVNGWLWKGAREGTERKTCWPGFQEMTGLRMVTRVTFPTNGANVA